MPRIDTLAMPSDVDRQIQRSAELLQRVSARQIQRRARSAVRRVRRTATYAFAGVSTILLVAILWSLIVPIGFQGVMLTGLAILLTLVASVLLSGERAMETVELNRTDLLTLPGATERWLETRRRALPAPAMPILDRIGARLEGLAPQLHMLNPREPAALEVRALLSEHLPQLVDGYRAIPQDLRRVERNGRLPDRQLLDGLALIEREIGEMTESLARGDLDRFAAHGRYLELRYDDPEDIGGR